eukprot:15448969-Alexandrium_andersonii.AAC.1
MQQCNAVGQDFQWKDFDDALPGRVKRHVQFEDKYYDKHGQWIVDNYARSKIALMPKFQQP